MNACTGRGINFTLLFFLSIGFGSWSATAPADESAAMTQAKKVVEFLEKQDFQATVAEFDQTMAKALPVEKLQSIWQGLVGQAQAGAFQKILDTKTQTAQSYQVVIFTCQFQNRQIDIKVVLDSQQKIAGLFFMPTSNDPARVSPIPAYVVKLRLRKQKSLSVLTAGNYLAP